MSTNLVRMQGDSPEVGGFLIQFPSGCKKQVAWRSNTPLESREAAKKYAITIVDTLLKEGRDPDIRNTNWTSVQAAIARIISDWNGLLTEHIRRQAGHDDASIQARGLPPITHTN